MVLRAHVRAFLFVGLVGLTLAGAPGCAAPSLPLPPPNALTSGPDATGYVTVDGEVLADAYVLCLNLDLDEGVIVRADERGVFSLRIRADVGHTLSVWQQIGNDLGPPRDLLVPPR